MLIAIACAVAWLEPRRSGEPKRPLAGLEVGCDRVRAPIPGLTQFRCELLGLIHRCGSIRRDDMPSAIDGPSSERPSHAAFRTYGFEAHRPISTDVSLPIRLFPTYGELHLPISFCSARM